MPASRQDKRNSSAAAAKMLGTGTTRASLPDGKMVYVVQEGNQPRTLVTDETIMDN